MNPGEDAEEALVKQHNLDEVLDTKENKLLKEVTDLELILDNAIVHLSAFGLKLWPRMETKKNPSGGSKAPFGWSALATVLSSDWLSVATLSLTASLLEVWRMEILSFPP